jgi:hypothetical protein
MILEDGTATCDRCGVSLPGYGILYGLVVDAGTLMIFCYVNDCRSIITSGLINYTTPGVCSNTGQPVILVSSEALVCADLDPVDPTQMRRLAFCRALGCADKFLPA